MQKAFQSHVYTHFTPEVHVQAQEAVDGYVLCRCFCQKPDQGGAKGDALLRRVASLVFTDAALENKQQPKFQWLQGAMADTSKFARHPSIHFELILHWLEMLLLTAAGMATARTLRGNASLCPE